MKKLLLIEKKLKEKLEKNKNKIKKVKKEEID